MPLNKCCSNKDQTSEPLEFSLDGNSEKKIFETLGMLWNSLSGIFTYKVSINSNSTFTEQGVLSLIARIVDSLWLLKPAIAKAKIFMQQL